jgi:hypothetical protein
MASAAHRKLTNSQVSGFPSTQFQSALSCARALFSLQCEPGKKCRPMPSDAEARDTRLARDDALREAALALSLGGGVSLTGREYQLIERLWRTDP